MVKIISVNARSPQIDAITEAASLIRDGGLIIYPTDTVYGLGADATSDEAVAKVFVAKARPIENPLPVILDSVEMAKDVIELNSAVELLFERFMPGPLTVVGKAIPGKVSKLITGGTGNLGVRIPESSVALKLVNLVGGPITATSANISGRPAPATAKEALNQLQGRVEIVLNSGRCKIGKPSTVIDVSSKVPKIVREGPITKAAIVNLLNELKR